MGEQWLRDLRLKGFKQRKVNTMSNIAIGCLCLLCVGIGFLIGTRSLNEIENTLENVEKGLDYIESAASVSDSNLDNFNTLIKANQYITSLSHIDMLDALENNDPATAKELLVNSLGTALGDAEDEIVHEQATEEDVHLISEINKRSKKYDSFKKIVNYYVE